MHVTQNRETKEDKTCSPPQGNFGSVRYSVLILKPYQLTHTLTKSNLFMIDYLKENGAVTIDKFRAAFKSLDKVTLKVHFSASGI